MHTHEADRHHLDLKGTAAGTRSGTSAAGVTVKPLPSVTAKLDVCAGMVPALSVTGTSAEASPAGNAPKSGA